MQKLFLETNPTMSKALKKFTDSTDGNFIPEYVKTGVDIANLYGTMQVDGGKIDFAKILRKYVYGLKTNKKIMVVSSTEQPIKRSGLSTLIFVPATAGLLCSNYVINDIIKS